VSTVPAQDRTLRLRALEQLVRREGRDAAAAGDESWAAAASELGLALQLAGWLATDPEATKALCLARMLLTSGRTTARVLRAAFDWADEILDGLDLCEAAEVDGELHRYEAELLEAVQELRGEGP
jgi:hypothetical protein